MKFGRANHPRSLRPHFEPLEERLFLASDSYIAASTSPWDAVDNASAMHLSNAQHKSTLEPAPSGGAVATEGETVFAYGAGESGSIGTLGQVQSQSASENEPAIRSGFETNFFSRSDDGSFGPIEIGFDINYFGEVYTHLFVNNNGNVTFGQDLGEYTPFDLTSTEVPIIAPFFADVHTSTHGQPVSWGTGEIDGNKAFVVNWFDVDYYSSSANHGDQLNTFQLVLIDGSADSVSGDFAIELNYGTIRWETGDASGGTAGLGGDSARVGFSAGTGAPNTFFELPGSGVPGSFLDGNQALGLVRNSLNSNQPGRYVFEVHNGTIDFPPDGGALPINTITLGSISTDSDVDEWTFFARTHQELVVVADIGSSLTPVPALTAIDVRVFAPDGTVIASGISTSTDAALTLPFVCPLDGTYRVEIRGADADPDATGFYLISAWNATVDAYDLVQNQRSTGLIESPYSVDRWSFAAAENDRVRFHLSNAATNDIVFRLSGANGWIGFADLTAR
ncbi:MAG: nidogen-like domain-containing protein [Pirellulales bacterium]